MYFLYFNNVSSNISSIFFFRTKFYFLNWSHDFILTFRILQVQYFLWKNLPKIFLIFFSDLLFDNFFNCVKMIVFENIVFKLFKLLIAKRTAMMAIYSLFDTWFTIYMSTSRYIAIADRIQAYCTLKLSL